MKVSKDLADIASCTQALSLLLIRSPETSSEALDGDHTDPSEPLTLGEECLLPEERREEARINYKALQDLVKNEVRLIVFHPQTPLNMSYRVFTIF